MRDAAPRVSWHGETRAESQAVAPCVAQARPGAGDRSDHGIGIGIGIGVLIMGLATVEALDETVWESRDIMRVPVSVRFRDGDQWAVFAEKQGSALESTTRTSERHPCADCRRARFGRTYRTASQRPDCRCVRIVARARQ